MKARLHVAAGLAPGALIELPAAAAHHALRVLRLGEGDAVTLFNGTGGQWQASLLKQGRVRIEGFEAIERESPLEVTLLQCLPAADKMDFIVHKGVELGVSAIVPVISRRSVVRLSGERMARRVQHWQAVAVAACEQCGRNRVPKVAGLVELPAALTAVSRAGGTRYLLSPQADQSLRLLAAPEEPLTLLVGPEGGFDEAELQAARRAGFTAVRLGPRVLRTETAGLAALAAIQTLWGDF